MYYKRLLFIFTAVFLVGCSEHSIEIEVDEIIAGEEIKVEAEEAEEAEEAHSLSDFQLINYEGTWEEEREGDAPYLLARLEKIEGDTATMFIDSISQGEFYIASAYQENVLFEDSRALLTYEDDGSGASGEVEIELFEDEIKLTVKILQEGQPFWRIPEGEYHLVNKQQMDEVEIPVEEETALSGITGQPVEGSPQTDDEYLAIASEIMEEFEIHLNSMYQIYSFGYNNPGDFKLVKPHMIHLVTETFAEESLKPYVQDYYCECDSILLPGIDERLSNISIVKQGEETYQVIGDFLMNPMAPEPDSMTQILEFKKQDQAWKLNSWRYED